MAPSASGLDLSKKSMAVFFVNENAADSAFFGDLAQCFATRMQSEYKCGEIPVFSVPGTVGDTFASRDTLISLLSIAPSDVVFLVQPSFEMADFSSCQYHFYAYDSMNKDDKVLILKSLQASKDDVMTGFNTIVDNFKPTWNEGEYILMSFVGPQWDNAMNYAGNCYWNKAIDTWMKILDDCQSLSKRSAAEYNIAVGCHMLGDEALAQKWLKRAKDDGYAPVAPTTWPGKK